jgi:hypothetical protein
MGNLLQDSQRRIQLIRQTNPRTFPTTGTPLIMTSWALRRQTPDQARTEFRPLGYQADQWTALLRHFETFQGDISPDFEQIEIILEMLCGAPVVSATTMPGGQAVKRDFYVPESLIASIQHFAMENGYTAACKRMLYSLLTAFSINVKRGNQPGISAQATVMFNRPLRNTDNTENFTMSGATAQSAIVQVLAGNVTGDGVFTLNVGGQNVGNITFTIGDTTATTAGKFLALGVTATVTGTITTGAGETHRIYGPAVFGNASFYGGLVTLNPYTSTPASVQAAIQALGGDKAARTVAGTITAPIDNVLKGGTATATPVTGTAQNAIDGNSATVATLTNQNDGYNPQSVLLTIDRGVGAADIAVSQVIVDAASNGFSAQADDYVETSATGANGTWTKITGNFQVFYQNGVATVANCLQGAVAKRYIRLALPTNQGAFSSWQIKEFSVVPANPVPGFVDITITVPSAAANVTDIESNVGTGYTTTNTQPGNAGGAFTATVTAPGNVPVLLVPFSGAGYSSNVVRNGGDGTTLKPTPYPMLPQHFSVRRSATLALLSGSSPLNGVHETNLEISNVVEPDQDFDEGELGYTDHVGGDLQMTSKIVFVSDELDASSQVQSMKDKADESPARPEWYQVRAMHPDQIRSFRYEGVFAVNAPYAPTAGGQVYQYEFPMKLQLNNELRDPRTNQGAILRFTTTRAT